MARQNIYNCSSFEHITATRDCLLMKLSCKDRELLIDNSRSFYQLKGSFCFLLDSTATKNILPTKKWKVTQSSHRIVTKWVPKNFSPIPKDSAYLTLVNKFILLIVHFWPASLKGKKSISRDTSNLNPKFQFRVWFGRSSSWPLVFDKKKKKRSLPIKSLPKKRKIWLRKKKEGERRKSRKWFWQLKRNSLGLLVLYSPDPKCLLYIICIFPRPKWDNVLYSGSLLEFFVYKLHSTIHSFSNRVSYQHSSDFSGDT